MRRLLVLPVVATACAIVAAPASATTECRGLQVCVPVAGPWVLASPGQVEFQLACPKKFVIGGLDAAREAPPRAVASIFISAVPLSSNSFDMVSALGYGIRSKFRSTMFIRNPPITRAAFPSRISRSSMWPLTG